MRRANDRRHRPGFTLTELIVVVGVVVLIMGLLLVALSSARSTTELADSQNRLRQIGTFMRQYATSNREIVVPSQFDYSGNSYPGKVRASDDLGELRHQGTWADIIWSEFELGPVLAEQGNVWRHDAPDETVYDFIPNYEHVLRSAALSTRNAPSGDGVPAPFGDGAQQAGLPGFFAANNFFRVIGQPDTQSGPMPTYYSLGQIKFADRSMYLVDSWAGETIEPECEPFDNLDPGPDSTLEVDFRYADACLMLFLDGHIDAETAWDDLFQLEDDRKVRVRNLTSNVAPEPCD